MKEESLTGIFRNGWCRPSSLPLLLPAGKPVLSGTPAGRSRLPGRRTILRPRVPGSPVPVPVSGKGAILQAVSQEPPEQLRRYITGCRDGVFPEFPVTVPEAGIEPGLQPLRKRCSPYLWKLRGPCRVRRTGRQSRLVRRPHVLAPLAVEGIHQAVDGTACAERALRHRFVPGMTAAASPVSADTYLRPAPVSSTGYALRSRTGQNRSRSSGESRATAAGSW